MNKIKTALRQKYQLPIDAFLIGSAQRDTEGAGISMGQYLPKLEKGPDILCDYIVQNKTRHQNLHVVLIGWRRQYVISRLLKEHVPFTYFERPPQQNVNELYQCLDLYPVTARCEGSPQSLIECGLLNISVISTPVGIAEQVLPPCAIAIDFTADALSATTPAVPNVEHLKLPMGYEPYRRLIESL